MRASVPEVKILYLMIKQRRKPYKSDLTDEQWGRIKPILFLPAKTGRPRCNEREIINGILYILTTGCHWEDMPHDIDASYQTCNRHLLGYQKKGIWPEIEQELGRFRRRS